MTKKQLLKSLKASMKNIAAERDGLRHTVMEFNDLAEKCDSATQDIERAIESLSELV